MRRPIGQVSRDDLLTLGGALFSSLSITLLLFGRLTPLSGLLGFAVVWFVMFLVIPRCWCPSSTTGRPWSTG